MNIYIYEYLYFIEMVIKDKTLGTCARNLELPKRFGF
jgi:hypothetical protein